jgi:Fe-S-cluster containining protein
MKRPRSRKQAKRRRVDKDNKVRTECVRCGTCCQKGGPVLHQEDKKILLAGHIGHKHLATIRKGELARNPVNDLLEPVHQELIKVRGKGDDWTCCFYNEKESSCAVYEHRLLECRLLKCWDPSDLLSVIGRDTIVRADIINPDDPIVDIIKTHELECPYDEIENSIDNILREKDKAQNLERLTQIVNKDLSMRQYALSELGLDKDFELFIFGRPLFKILSDRGLPFRGTDGIASLYSSEHDTKTSRE